MRSGWVAVAVFALLTACGFNVSGGVPGDGSTDDVRPDSTVDIDGATDGQTPDATSVCAGRKRWSADFSVDPRTVDFESDGTNDWALRQTASAVPLPGTLANGVWSVPDDASPPLDTRPLDDWNGITTASVRMRATNNTSNEGSADEIYGVVFWLNAGFGNGDFAAIIVGITRLGSTQAVQLYTKPNADTRRAEGLPILVGSGMVDIDLMVDMTTNFVRMEVASDVRTASLTQYAQGGNTDQFATLYAWNNDAEFDNVDLTNCP